GGERLQLGGLGKWLVGGVVQFVESGAVVVELTGCGVELVWGSGDDVLNAGHDAARQGCATGLGLVLSRLGVVGEAVGFPSVERATGGPWGPELVLVDEGRGDGEVSVPEDDLVGFHESGGLEWNAGDSGDVLVFVDAGTVQAGVRPAQALKELIG